MQTLLYSLKKNSLKNHIGAKCASFNLQPSNEKHITKDAKDLDSNTLSRLSIKTSKRAEMKKSVRESFLIALLLHLQSCHKDAEEGIGHFPRLKDAAVEVKRESKYHVISLLTCTKV